MHKKPFFSIITATYNSSLTLRKTLDSILNLNFKDFEYIIIDGKSVDNTIEIILEFEGIFSSRGIQFRWISEIDKGIYDAWNKGIQLANGEWISFLGSDDYYLENALEIYKQSITINCNYIHSKVQLINEKDEKLRVLGGDNFTEVKFFRNMNIAHVGSFHHKSLFINEKFSLKYKSASDYFFFLKNFDKLKPCFINKTTAVMQFGGISTHVKGALKEALDVKIDSKRRSKFLCYLDFFVDHFKHFLLKYIRKT